MVRLIALNDTCLDDRNQRCVMIAHSIYDYRGVINEYQWTIAFIKKKKDRGVLIKKKAQT